MHFMLDLNHLPLRENPLLALRWPDLSKRVQNLGRFSVLLNPSSAPAQAPVLRQRFAE